MTQFRGAGASGSWAPKRRPTFAEWWAQTGTKRMIVDPIISGLTLPGDVYAGRVDPRSDEAIQRAADLAGVAATGGLGGVAREGGEVLASGIARKGTGSRLPQPPGGAQLGQRTALSGEIGKEALPVQANPMLPDAVVKRSPTMTEELAKLLDDHGLTYRVEHSTSNTDHFGPSSSTYYILDDGTKIRVSDHAGPIPSDVEVGLREGAVTPAQAVGRILKRRGSTAEIEDRFADAGRKASDARASEEALAKKRKAVESDFAVQVSSWQRMSGKKMKPRDKQALREELEIKHGLQAPFPETNSARAGIGPAGTDLASGGKGGAVAQGGISGIRAYAPQESGLAGARALSPEFRKWFGGSKVVDAGGEPLIVYRGDLSNKTQFNGNVFFSDRRAIGERYARGGELYPSYLSLKKPLVVDAGGNDWMEVPAPKQIKDEWGDPDKTIQIDYLADWAKKQGYDGLIVRNVVDQWGDGDQFIAFEPTQIKSVNNRGAFNPSDPNVLASGGKGGAVALAPLMAGGVAASAMAPQESQAQAMPQFRKVQAPDGQVIEFPADMSDADISAVMQREFGGPQENAAPEPKSERGTFLDPFIGQGLMLGAGDEIKSAVRAGVKAPFSEQTFGEIYDKELASTRKDLGSYRERHPYIAPAAEIAGAVTGVAATGGAGLLPRAATTAGKIGMGAAEGAALGGAYGFNAGEGGAVNRLKGAGVGAATGTAGGAAGGALAGTMTSRAAKAAAPTVDDLKAAGSAAFRRVDQAGVTFSPQAFTNIVDDVIRTAGQSGIDRSIHPKAWAALNRLFQERGKSPTFSQVHLLRRVLGSAAASAEPDERRIASIMIEKLDEHLDNLSPLHVIGGNPQQAATAFREGMDLWSRMRKGEIIEDLVERAKTAAPNFSGSGLENALRTQFRQLAMNKKAMRKFSMEEKSAIMKVARGGPLENTLRMLGKFAPTGVVSSVLSGGAGYTVGGPAGGIALPAMGFAARQAATAMTKGNVDKVGNLVRAGGPIPQQPLSKKQQALLTLLLGGGASSGPSVQNQPWRVPITATGRAEYLKGAK